MELISSEKTQEAERHSFKKRSLILKKYSYRCTVIAAIFTEKLEVENKLKK
jgi:hypothetical protein